MGSSASPTSSATASTAFECDTLSPRPEARPPRILRGRALLAVGGSRCHDLVMGPAATEAGIAEGYEALASGNWAAARAAFEAALAREEFPEALDGLGRALWWLRKSEQAVVYRERAYSGFRRDGQLARAARIAIWLSREYALVWGNEAAANGWLARAERLLADVAPDAERGWVELARSERAREPAAAGPLAASALEVAVATGDADLELRALAQLGLSEVSVGEVDKGLTRLDEAMAAATGGEPATLETFADVCCTLMLACELAGDVERPKQWSEVFEAFVRKYDHVSLLAFCRTCCADVYAANGRVDAAEEELLEARLAELARSSLLAAPLLAQLVEAELADGDVAGARRPAAELAAIADTSGRERVAALAALAQGRVALAAEDPRALELLQRAVNLFAALPSPLGAARARLELARAHAGSAPQVAIDLARRARTELESLGAVREADAAAALMRDLGAKGRAGPKDYGLLSRRELEVLRLVGEGLTNGEIGARLFISPKTAEHHVGRIYSKLNLRTRTELAAYAVRNLGME